MKSLIICSIFIFLLSKTSFCQVDSGKFENVSNSAIKLKLTVFENSKDGKKGKIYLLTDTKFRIYDKPFEAERYTEHLYTKHKFKSKELFREISKLNLDTLDEIYFNNCIESNKGYDYSIMLVSESKTTSIKLHHYFIKDVDDLFVLLNKYLPQTFQIQYLSKDNKQDCGILN